MTKDSYQTSEIQTIVDGVNLKLENNDFVIIIGSVGSGKSSLLYSILGET